MKIMIVDDEPLILTGIESIIINEFGKSMELVKAFDGIDALDKLQNFTPDLIITDICMPEMSGLDFIKEVLKVGICDRFIILTGYADFEYARQALQYKALDYILKPIDKTQLVGLIRSISEGIKTEQEKLVKQELNKLKESMLYNVPYDELFIENNIINTIFPFPKFIVILMQIEDNCFEFDLKMLDNIIPNFFNKYYVFSLQYKKQIMILANFENEICERVLYKELFILNTKKDCNLKSIGISGTANSLEYIHTLYNNALRHLYFNKYSFGDGAFDQSDVKEVFSLLDYNDIASILESGSQEEMDNLLNGYLEKLLSINKKDNFHLSCVYSIVISDITIYLQEMGLSLDNISEVNNCLKNESVNIKDDKELKNQIGEIFAKTSKYLRKKDDCSRYSEGVSKMLDFINENYMRDISLDDMAETVSLHPNYTSSLFKKEIGTSFIQYLNSYRVLKAKAFLKRNTDLSLDKIAEMVGYENSGHFIKVFKKYANITPGEYRNKVFL